MISQQFQNGNNTKGDGFRFPQNRRPAGRLSRAAALRTLPLRLLASLDFDYYFFDREPLRG